MKKKVLVTDDNADIRETVKAVLEFEDMDVVMAQDGKTALEQIAKERPDLILLDLKMPGMTTNEFITIYQKLKLKMPIILFSASRERETKENIEKLETGGFKTADYIEKPFENEDLVKRIKKVLNKH
ncbi:MAG TPA: response regulator [Candidatus Nanoarchaeia archaeon]|nr:response regulator [Candidatus Nanoarchaeia archaeon]